MPVFVNVFSVLSVLHWDQRVNTASENKYSTPAALK